MTAYCDSSFFLRQLLGGENRARPLRSAAAELFTRSTPQHGWRTVDLVHVATATSTQAMEFFSFDHRQNTLAKKQGLKVPLLGLSAS